MRYNHGNCVCASTFELFGFYLVCQMQLRKHVLYYSLSCLFSLGGRISGERLQQEFSKYLKTK